LAGEAEMRVNERLKKQKRDRKMKTATKISQLLSQLMRERWANPEFREKRIAAIKKGVTTPKARKKYSEAQKKVWADPTKRKKISDAIRNAFAKPSVRRKMSKSAKKRFSNLIERKKSVARLEKMWTDPEYRAKQTLNRQNRSKKISVKISKSVQKLWKSPDYRAKMARSRKLHNQKISDSIKKCWLDPERRKRRMQSFKKPDFQHKMSLITQNRWNNLNSRRKLLGSKNSISGLESKAHYNLKKIAGNILTKQGFVVQYEFPLCDDKPFYIIDVYGKKEDVEVLVEVGGCKIEKRAYLSATFSHFYHIPFDGDINVLREIPAI